VHFPSKFGGRHKSLRSWYLCTFLEGVSAAVDEIVENDLNGLKSTNCVTTVASTTTQR
jgi:hypothetical protein